MEKLEHPFWIVQLVNALLGPLVRRAGEAIGYHFTGHDVIPAYMVMVLLIVVFITALCVFVRSRLSVENPGTLQIILEDGLGAVRGLLDEWIGPKGHEFLPLVATLGLFILLGNYMGLIPGLMSPTSSINVTLGCAITTWVYYHYQGIRAQGIVGYVKHFWAPPGAPMWIGVVYFPIEIISHAARHVAVAQAVRQHLRRGTGHSGSLQPRAVPGAAPDDAPRTGDGAAAGVHLHAAVDHLSPGRRGRRAPRGRARARRAERATGAGCGVSIQHFNGQRFFRGGLARE